MSFSRQEIIALFKTAKRSVRHPILDILIAPKAQEKARLLVITPKRVGTAPARNKIRRQLKALFYEQGYAQQAFDCVIIIKNIGRVTFEKLQELMTTALHKR